MATLALDIDQLEVTSFPTESTATDVHLAASQYTGCANCTYESGEPTCAVSCIPTCYISCGDGPC